MTCTKFTKMRKKAKNKKAIRKRIDPKLVKELNSNLIDILTNNKFISPPKDKKMSSQSEQSFYLLYFCSNFTATTNSTLFDNVLKFLSYMKEKIECSIRIILVSSDQSQEDYNSLLEKYKIYFVDKESEGEEERASFTRLALDFNCKAIKEKLFHELHISGIPWFSLTYASGEILCENLKIFILNSQLREIVF